MKGFYVDIAGITIFFDPKGLSLSKEAGVEEEFKGFVCKAGKKPDLTLSFKQNSLLRLRKSKMLFDLEGLRQVHRAGENILYVHRDGKNSDVIRIFEVNQNRDKVNVYFRGKEAGALIAETNLNFLRPFLPDYLAVKKQGIMVHGVFLKDNGKTYLFMGKSGAGKSTLAMLWARNKKAPYSRQAIFNDDRAVLKVVKNRVAFYNVPWAGDAWEYCELKPQGGIKVDSIFFIHHSQNNAAKRLPRFEAAIRIFKHTFPVFWNRQGLSFALGICEKISQRVPCFELGFHKDKAIMDFVRKLK